MTPVLTKRDTATKKKATDGQTLKDIAVAEGLTDWEPVALYNWGTVDPVEVNRHLFEWIGWNTPNVNPGLTVLKPDADADREILVPKLWNQDTLALDKTHTVKAKPEPEPPTAIVIEKLDRWFIPGLETCDIKYSLEGLAKCAVKVDLEVYGSNYCTAGDWNKGLVKFTGTADLKDTKIYNNAEQTAAPERSKNLAAAEWKGKVKAATGALGKKNPGPEDRVINAAFSPYTVMVRYYKDGADNTARLDLDSFWPQFDATTGDAVLDSLKIRWAIRGSDRCSSTNGGGTLLVVDGLDQVVFRKPLKLTDLAKMDAGFSEFPWTGVYSVGTKQNSAGGTKAIEADMPYRVQIQVHTGPGQTKGLALAAMHTEVRLYVNPTTHPLSLNPYVPETDPASLGLRCERELLATKKYVRADGTAWIQQELARAGYHPGPVDGAAKPAYAAALREFKRSVPKRKAKPTDPFQRFTIDTTEGDDVKDAIADLATAATKRRAWFANPGSNRADYPFDDAGANTRLADKTGDLVVWVDDRHYYTDPGWLNPHGGPRGIPVQTKITGDPAGMGNYALTYTSGDAVIDMKTTEIPRPWIPLAVDIPLLGKSKKLTDTIATFSVDELKAMGKAVGPIRVDWSFDEIEADPPTEPIIDVTMYSNQVNRPKLHVETARIASYPSHVRKDVNKTSKYSNCPAANAGARPAVDADYYKAVFGFGDAESLAPWQATPDAAFETIASVAHDNVGQADASTFATRFGQAGVYFRPSTIGGDGYRVRAQVRFKPVGDYKLPNLAVLEKRYPTKLPQVESARIRVWRKASLRGYVSWGPNNSWGTHSAGLFKHLEAAYLQFVFEDGDASVNLPIGSMFSEDSAYRTLVQEALQSGGGAPAEEVKRAKKDNIKFQNNRMWPWNQADQFGIYEPSDPGATFDAARTKFIGKMTQLFFLLSNLYALDWAQKVEKRSGKLRGHIVVEFQCGDNWFMQQYACPTCVAPNNTYYYVEKNARGNSMLGEKCPARCGSKLQKVPFTMTGHYTCGAGHAHEWDENSAAGGQFAGYLCPTLVGGVACNRALAAVSAQRADYKCNKCGWTFAYVDATGATFVDDPCRQPTCTGKMKRTGSAGLYNETYACDKCNADVRMTEIGVLGGGHSGETHSGCPKLISGKLRRKTPNATGASNKVTLSDIAHKSGYTGIPVPSLGDALGVSYNFEADAELWAHELAHNRYMEHAANAPGAANDQHDHEANTFFNFGPLPAGINETVATSQAWDRACLMTYVNHLATYSKPRDRRVLCGKCTLKIRGWKLAGVNNPAGGLHE